MMVGCSATCFSSRVVKTDRERWAFRGPVRLCRQRHTSYVRSCGAESCETEERSSLHETDFDAGGSLVRQWTRNPDGSEWTNWYEYDALHRMIASRTVNLQGQEDRSTTSYDATGRPTGRTVHPHNGPERLAETYDYDDATRTKTVHNVANQRPNTGYGGLIAGGGACPACGAVRSTTRYDLRDEPVEEISFDADGHPLSRVEFSYDERGNLVSEIRSTPAGFPLPKLAEALEPAQLEELQAAIGSVCSSVTTTHRYDERDRRIETLMRTGRLGFYRHTVEYDELGNEVHSVDEHESHELSLELPGGLMQDLAKTQRGWSEACLDYDYNSLGDWLRKTVRARSGPDQEFTLSSVEERTIEYFAPDSGRGSSPATDA